MGTKYNAFKKWFKEEFLGEVLGTAGVVGGYAGLKALFARGAKVGAAELGSVLTERAKKVFAQKPRRVLWLALLGMKEKDREEIRARHREAKGKGHENWLIKVISENLPKDKDGKVDEELTKAALKELNQMDKEEFDQFMDIGDDDPIMENILYWGGKTKDIGKALLLAAAQAEGVAERELGEFFTWLNSIPAALPTEQLRERVERREALYCRQPQADERPDGLTRMFAWCVRRCR